MKILHIKTLYFFALISPPFLFASCQRECTDDGSKQYNMAPFNSVESGDENLLFITYADKYSVNATGCENDIKDLVVEVKGEKLVLRYDSFRKWHRGLSVHITMPHFNGAALSGESKAHVAGFADTTSKVFDLSGQSSCTYIGHAAATLITISGQSDLTIHGVVEKLKVEASGQSKFNGYGMMMNQVAGVILSGQSKAYIFTNGVLNADVSGQSTLHYRGNPVSRHLHSSGQSDIIHD